MQKKKHCCLHCNKTISRAQNLKLHQQTCEQNGNRNEYRRYYGVDADAHNGGFKLIESALKKMFVTYRKVLDVNALQRDDMKLVFSRGVKNVLWREVLKRKGIKLSLALKVIMHLSVDPAVVTDPPAVFNADMVVGLIGSNYEDELKTAFENVMQQIDEYQRNGSGWVLDQFLELDVRNINEDEDDYDEENEESGEM